MPFSLKAINMKVGDTEVLDVGNISHLQGCQWTISRPNDVVFVTTPQSYTTRVTIKAVHGFPSTSPCIVQCKYYYLELDPTTGRYIYSRTGFKDWTIFVDEPKPTGISLSPGTLTMTKGGSASVIATVTPSSAADDKIDWYMSDASVATFFKMSNNKVNVVAQGSGKTKLTATTSNGISTACWITVQSSDPTGVSVSPSTLELTEGSSKQLTATVTPSGASTTLTWKSNDTGVATVSTTGYVTAKSTGTATITVTTSNGYSGSCKVTVKPLPTSVSLPATQSVAKGSKITLKPTLTPSNATTTYTWSSDNTKIATVSTSGDVTGVEQGTANITVKTANGKQAVCKVTVKEPVEPTSVKLDKSSAQITKGYYLRLKAELAPSDASTTFTWTSSDTSIATITSTGLISGVKEGEVTITVKTKNEKTSTCKVKVVASSTKTEVSKVTPKITSLMTLIENSVEQITQ